MALPREIKPVRNENQSKESPIDDNPSEGRLSLVGEHSQPFLLCWSRLSKSVQISEKSSGLLNRSITVASENKKAPTRKQKKDPITKTILNQVSGQAVPGEILALMGPSGSGKTTLLDSLSGRTALNSGVITVNGNQIQSKEKSSALTQSMKRFNSKVAYVKQEDVFFDHLTVRDQLAYTAFLRMPQALSRQVKLDGVEGILKLLRLSKVANSPIKSLSGGEKKRVNIATELLTNPSCLLLDEPTSGLDSTSAVALVRLLQHLALQQQKTVIMSIHQPSSGIFLGFDSLLLLAEGSVVYFGSPTYSINYLAKKDLACPAGECRHQGRIFCLLPASLTRFSFTQGTTWQTIGWTCWFQIVPLKRRKP
jgi:ABC-type multidrug transport system ATPase subunit